MGNAGEAFALLVDPLRGEHLGRSTVAHWPKLLRLCQTAQSKASKNSIPRTTGTQFMRNQARLLRKYKLIVATSSSSRHLGARCSIADWVALAIEVVVRLRRLLHDVEFCLVDLDVFARSRVDHYHSVAAQVN
jgi:hypothetical protein